MILFFRNCSQTLKKITDYWLTSANVLFAVLLIVLILPEADAPLLLSLAALVEVYQLGLHVCKAKGAVQANDVATVFFGILLVWEILTAKLEVLDSFLFPAPENVLEIFIADLPAILKGLGNSLVLLSAAYGLAVIIAIPAGLLIGWRRRLYNAVQPLSKVFSAVPPIVYIPYSIAILPTFQMASVLVIAVGAFWPIFVSTLNATVQIDKTLIDSARMLRISERRMLFEIILPAAMPQVLTGCSVGLIFSFILLASAEMIGATSGIGWYVKYYSDFGDYGKVIVGILFIGIVVTVAMAVFDFIHKRLLRWQARAAGH